MWGQWMVPLIRQLANMSSVLGKLDMFSSWVPFIWSLGMEDGSGGNGSCESEVGGLILIGKRTTEIFDWNDDINLSCGQLILDKFGAVLFAFRWLIYLAIGVGHNAFLVLHIFWDLRAKRWYWFILWTIDTISIWSSVLCFSTINMLRNRCWAKCCSILFFLRFLRLLKNEDKRKY